MVNVFVNLMAVYPLLLSILVKLLASQLPAGCVTLFGEIQLLAVLILTTVYYFKKSGQVRRLSPFFKSSIISQKPSKEVTGESNCQVIITNLYEEMNTLPNKFTNDWTYIAITHDAVIRALKRRDVINSYGLTLKLNCGKVRLKQIQKALLNGRCKKCLPSKRDECAYRKMGEERRQFYLIKFHTKTQ